MITKTPASGEIEKWLRSVFSQNFDFRSGACRSETKTQNLPGVDPSTSNPCRSLVPNLSSLLVMR